MRGRTLMVVAVVLIGGLVLLELATSGSEEDRPGAPPLPSAVLVPPKVTIESLRGRPAVVNFWASWCDPCRKEADHLQRFYERNRGRVAMVGVNYTDESAGARAFIREYGWTFPNLSDPDGLTGSTYNLAGLPVTVILDSEGKISARLRGPQTQASLARAVREAESN